MNSLIVRKILSAVVVIASFGLRVSDSNAQSFSGRFYTAFYTWEREVFGEDPTKHFQSYNGAIFHIRQLGFKNLSFHTYIRFSNDLASNGFSLQNKLYNAYFELNQVFNNRINASFGRQFIWAGVGNGTIDGGKIELNLYRFGKLGAYIGTMAPLRESWKVDSWAESHMIGAYYKYRLYETDVQLSWVRKNRKAVSYSVPGQYTERKISVPSLRGQLAGLDISRQFAGKVTLFLRAEGTIKENKKNRLDPDRFTFDRFDFTADIKAHKKLMFTGQYLYRKPRANLNSIFSVFSQSDNREFLLNVYYYPSSFFTLFGGIATVRYDFDDTNRYNLGLVSKFFTINLNKYTGYSGDLDGITGSIQHPIGSNLWTRAAVTVGRYKLFDDTADYNNMVTSSLGVSYNPKQSISIDLEGQNLRNKLSDTDIRFFGRINYWFFAKR